jgi:thioredoxin 2
MASDKVATFTDADFGTAVLKSSEPVLVDFWAEWCGPCRLAAPEVSRTVADMAGKAIVLKVDTEKHPQLAARFNVQAIPNFVILSGGKVVRQQPGLVKHDQLERWLCPATPVFP